MNPPCICICYLASSIKTFTIHQTYIFADLLCGKSITVQEYILIHSDFCSRAEWIGNNCNKCLLGFSSHIMLKYFRQPLMGNRSGGQKPCKMKSKCISLTGLQCQPVNARVFIIFYALNIWQLEVYIRCLSAYIYMWPSPAVKKMYTLSAMNSLFINQSTHRKASHLATLFSLK